MPIKGFIIVRLKAMDATWFSRCTSEANNDLKSEKSPGIQGIFSSSVCNFV